MMKTFDLGNYPTSSGVYLMRDAGDKILYVGKAKNLRSRLRSYFSATGDSRPQVRFLLGRVERIETIVTDTEKEALILENTLIKKHRPRYNLDLRDDKTYVSVRIDPREEFPGLQVVRRVVQDGALYFGPYASAAGVRETLKEIYRIFPLRHYPLAACRRRGRPCLFFQIGQCSAPCHGRITPAEYALLVAGVVALLSGRDQEVVALLTERMRQAAEKQQYEAAARFRDQLRAVAQTLERQRVDVAAGGDIDVFGSFRQHGAIEVAILFVRRGKLIGRRTFALEWQLDEPALLAALLQQFYAGDVIIPDQILVPLPPEGGNAIAEWLSERKGKKVVLAVPRRGEKQRLVDLAARNAAESCRERGRKDKAHVELLQQLQTELKLRRLPQRLECFDISNTQGEQSVGSMAVLLAGEPARSEYRHFRIRTVAGADDYASLYEVLQRRLQRGVKEASLPDCILIDGGKGQLGVLSAVLQDLGLAAQIDAVGIAKSRISARRQGEEVARSEERFFLPGRMNPVVLRAGSPTLFLLARLRDEAHRFAVEHHRRLRGKVALTSELDTIPGVGPARRRLLLKHFGSHKKIAAATLDELCAVPGLPEAVARSVHRHLAQRRV
ncbi:MAG: excinuclease ABC subunit C [Desulfuromonadales bacterium GWD2_61_12]|nr:MAG: excinuclease ABC subunit C [Desulfuromonadales bacterium GWD2_61_12]